MSVTDTQIAEHGLNLSLVLHPLHNSDHPLGAHLRSVVKAGNVSVDTNAQVKITPHAIGGLKATVTVGSPVYKEFQGYFATGTAFSNINVQNAKGQLYYVGSPPADGDNQFWIQQYPGQTPEEPGRPVLEFYDEDKILFLPITFLRSSRPIMAMEAREVLERGELSIRCNMRREENSNYLWTSIKSALLMNNLKCENY
ncbi:hypothetical protein SERLA73DRAFT_154966 [Serpula lacrymans var. lacrymans S7.3]|uniref:Uncharacterized protein n=2 Tax=Serpula lacrymans var. lacrymans TaxID=341189 RepID=F8Q7S0_SERL3|nr:uncharacterized protein SERLADRAFT_441517 [Serpula lacrymans var. lacrymans S7.9]EGN95608.1 hypothetical protein SERLA73DRAFT_154966 [Serpula lacrymans var. lacrymans S7.3]EGO21139.1 hypothetical protein SERLADRAFT_441517 [Serpula lacrymans var. lacrymans S7.9]